MTLLDNYDFVICILLQNNLVLSSHFCNFMFNVMISMFIVTPMQKYMPNIHRLHQGKNSWEQIAIRSII